MNDPEVDRTSIERVPQVQVTPNVVWVAYPGGLRIAYAALRRLTLT